MLKSRLFRADLLIALYMVLCDGAYFIADGTDRTFVPLSFALVLCGAAVQAAYNFLPPKIGFLLPIAFCGCYSFAFAGHFFTGLETLSDTWNEVSFVTGNATMAVVFMVLFGIGLMASLATAFVGAREETAV